MFYFISNRVKNDKYSFRILHLYFCYFETIYPYCKNKSNKRLSYIMKQLLFYWEIKLILSMMKMDIKLKK